jgi:hypothetical protein
MGLVGGDAELEIRLLLDQEAMGVGAGPAGRVAPPLRALLESEQNSLSHHRVQGRVSVEVVLVQPWAFLGADSDGATGHRPGKERGQSDYR